MSNNSERRGLEALVKKIMRDQLRRFALDTTKVHLSWPVYDDAEILNALDSLLDLHLSQGPKVREFEQRFANYLGVRYATAVNSGSSANLLALATLVEYGKIKKDAEVIMPAATFSAVASPALHLGLVPVYVDVERDTWNIDPKEIERAITPRTRVIMAVHTFGNPANMPAIMRIAKKHKLFVIEDCCEAHGARIGKKKVGSFGDLATMSFFIAHNMTTGEGGMIFSDQKQMATIVSSLREFGRLPADVIRTRRLTYRDPETIRTPSE